VKGRLIEAYTAEGHTEEEVRQHWEKISAELDSKSLRQIVEDYSHIYKFTKSTLARAYEIEEEFDKAPKAQLSQYLNKTRRYIEDLLVKKFKNEQPRSDDEISAYR
jgi:hypothetical protein